MRRWWAYRTRCRKGYHAWLPVGIDRRYQWPRACYVREECENCAATRETEVDV